MGLTYRTIAIRVGCSVGSVHYVLQKKKETGTVKDKPITGRKRATTQHQDRIMTRISMANRQKTAPQIRAEMMEHHTLTLSVSTVLRRLREVGLKACRLRKTPRLTKLHKQKRLEFATKYRDWTEVDRSKVVFSDESRYQYWN